jgi:hypothetical protein
VSGDLSRVVPSFVGKFGKPLLPSGIRELGHGRYKHLAKSIPRKPRISIAPINAILNIVCRKVVEKFAPANVQ